jgi:hypothetical protein
MGKLLERLQDASRSGVYRAASADAIEEAVAGGGVDLARIACDAVKDKDALLKTIARARACPVLLFTDADKLAANDRGALLDLLRSTAAQRAARGGPFFAVFVDPQAALDLPSLYRERAK